VLSEQQVVQRSRKFICVAVDADRDPEICRTRGVRGYPTILVLSPDGREMARVTGKVALKTLVTMLDDVDSAAASMAAPATRTVR
jgi:thioredoxin-like negative regulator of GroEL